MQAAAAANVARAAAEGQAYWQEWLDEEGGWSPLELELVLAGRLVPPANVWEHLLQKTGEGWIAVMKKEGCPAVQRRLVEWETRRAATAMAARVYDV